MGKTGTIWGKLSACLTRKRETVCMCLGRTDSITHTLHVSLVLLLPEWWFTWLRWWSADDPVQITHLSHALFLTFDCYDHIYDSILLCIIVIYVFINE